MARKSIVIEVPGTPDRKLNANTRIDRRRSGDERRAIRGAAKYAAIDAMATLPDDRPVFHGPVRVYPVIGWEKGRQKLDGDNALYCLKSVWDGFTDAGVWGDDRYTIFDPVVQERDPAGVGFVRVTITTEEA